MKKFMLTTTAFLQLFFFTYQQLCAQNNVWSLPPYYAVYPGPQINPLPTGGQFYYQGQPAAYTHNAIRDAQNKVLFFVIDDKIYNKNGIVTGDIVNNSPDYYTYLNFQTPHQGRYVNPNSQSIHGASSIQIVPAPGDCDTYYILTASQFGVSNDPKSSSTPGYIKVNVDTLNVTKYPILNHEINMFTTNPSSDIQANTANNSSLFSSPPVNGNSIGCAISELKTRANKRIVALTDGSEIGVYRLDATGFSFLSKLNMISDILGLPISGITPVFTSMNEFEIYNLSNGNYKLAVGFSLPVNNSPNMFKTQIVTFDIDNSGNLINNSIVQSIFSTDNMSNFPFVTGLEFSENGNYLYFTHKTTALHPNAIGVIDIQSGNVLNITMPVSNGVSSDFQYSQIERIGNDIVLPFHNRLAKLENTNTPSNLVWTNQMVALTNYASSPGFLSGTSATNSFASYSLPTQIDGMDYTQHFYATPACCAKYSYYDYSTIDTTQNLVGTQIISGQTLFVEDKLVVKAGADITFNNLTVKFAQNARLIIEKGGKLTANNSLFTVDTRCAPNVMWSGVEVQGTRHSTQMTATAGYFISNNTVIEHAYKGVSNSVQSVFSVGVNTFNQNDNGGVIKMTNSTIRNCRIGGVFENHLNNFYMGSFFNDQSFFTNCVFYTDTALLDPAQGFQTHIRMKGVYGIKFKGCDFRNDIPVSGIYPLSASIRGRGIIAYDSKFSVVPDCVTASFSCPSLDRSVFKGLFRGVYVSNTIRSFSQDIDNCLFDNNYRAMYFNNVELSRIVKNQINVPQEQLTNQIAFSSYGMYLNNCDQYKVENNTFNTSAAKYGLLINNSGIAANEIYRNDFIGFGIATQAMNINADSSTVGINNGLVYRCNRFYATSSYDIVVTSGLIDDWQGSAATKTSPANNQFSYTATDGDIWNVPTPGNHITYFYNNMGNGNLSPRQGYYRGGVGVANPNTVISGVNQVFNYSTSCPNRLAPRPNTIGVVSQIGAHKRRIDSTQQLLNGGNAKVLFAAISSSSVSVSKRERLLSASPYVTDKVLISMIQTSGMNRQDIKDVLLANAPLSEAVMLAYVSSTVNYTTADIRDVVQVSQPLSTKEHVAFIENHNSYSSWALYQLLSAETPLFDEVLIALIKKTNQIPNWVTVNILMQNTPLSNAVLGTFWEYSTNYSNWQVYKVLLFDYLFQNSPQQAVEATKQLNEAWNSQLAIKYSESEMRRLNAEVLRIKLFDDQAQGDVKEVIAYLEQQKSKERLTMSQLYLMTKQTAKAQTAIDSVTCLKTRLMYNFISTVKQDSLGYKGILLDSTKLAYISQCANDTVNCISKSCAQSMLTNLDIIEFQELIEPIPATILLRQSFGNVKRYKEYVGENGMPNEAEQTPMEVEKFEVKIYPNPSNGILSVSVNGLNESEPSVQVFIYDISGKQLYSKKFGNNTIETIDMSYLSQGIYFCKVFKNTEMISQQKLIIQK